MDGKLILDSPVSRYEECQQAANVLKILATVILLCLVILANVTLSDKNELIFDHNLLFKEDLVINCP